MINGMGVRRRRMKPLVVGCLFSRALKCIGTFNETLFAYVGGRSKSWFSHYQLDAESDG